MLPTKQATKPRNKANTMNDKKRREMSLFGLLLFFKVQCHKQVCIYVFFGKEQEREKKTYDGSQSILFIWGRSSIHDSIK